MREMKVIDCPSSIYKRDMEEGKDIEFEEMTPMSGTPISQNLGTENTPVSRGKFGNASSDGFQQHMFYNDVSPKSSVNNL